MRVKIQNGFVYVEMEKNMTKILVPGIYGTEFEKKMGPFGLRCGQIRSEFWLPAHNSGWYNCQGEKIGWGDLSSDDLKRIAEEIPQGELFIVLSEEYSFGTFIEENPGLTGSLCTASPDEQNPGVTFVAEKCHIIVSRGVCFWVGCCSTPRIENLLTESMRREDVLSYIRN